MTFAFHAEIGVYDVYIPFRNGVNRALGQADAASDAVLGNFKRQSRSPLSFLYIRVRLWTVFLCIQYTNALKN